MTHPIATSQGFLDGPHGQTWWRVTGNLEESLRAGKFPLVVLHGGPGMTHDYLLRIAGLSDHGRAVVHYDQIGCGRSVHLPDAGDEFWNVHLFLAELDRLLDELGLTTDGYHLLGQSWGGMLAAEHAIRRPEGLHGLILANSPASMPLWEKGIDELRRDLPLAVQDTLSRHEAAGTTDSPEYSTAEKVFYDRHVCRIVPHPPELTATFDALDHDPTVYHSMVGPNEFHVTGSLKTWSVVDRLTAVDSPTLVLHGLHDEATATCVQPFLDLIPVVDGYVFEESSHLPHIEEEAAFLHVVENFLEKCETSTAPLCEFQ